MNGSATLTLVGNNTVNSVTFNNNGGFGNPVINPGGTLMIASGQVNVVSDNPTDIAVLNTGSYQFGTTPVFNISTNTPEILASDLQLNGTLSNTFGFGWQPMLNVNPLIKTGNGSMLFNTLHTFPNGVSVNQGTMILGTNHGTVTNGVLVSSQLGTGSLNLGTLATDTATLYSDANPRAVFNVVNLNGNVIFGGTTANNNVALQGVVNLVGLAGTTHTVTVPYPTVTAAFTGGVVGVGGLTKAGDGIMTLGVGADYTGPTAINAGKITAAGRVSHELGLHDRRQRALRPQRAGRRHRLARGLRFGDQQRRRHDADARQHRLPHRLHDVLRRHHRVHVGQPGAHEDRRRQPDPDQQGKLHRRDRSSPTAPSPSAARARSTIPPSPFRRP